MYDAGRSAFATVTIGAILPAYFQSTVVPTEGVVLLGDPWSAESLWGRMSGVGPLLLLVLLPVFGAVADRSGAKLGLLKVFAYSGAFVAAMLMFAGEGDVWFTLVVFLAALLLFAGGNVVYDGLLTDLTSPSTVHQASARGSRTGSSVVVHTWCWPSLRSRCSPSRSPRGWSSSRSACGGQLLPR